MNKLFLTTTLVLLFVQLSLQGQNDRKDGESFQVSHDHLEPAPSGVDHQLLPHYETIRKGRALIFRPLFAYKEQEIRRKKIREDQKKRHQQQQQQQHPQHQFNDQNLQYLDQRNRRW